MLENGFVKLHRSILKWEWYDDVPTKTLLIHLILTVNFYDETWRGIEIKRGSRVTSYANLARETGLSVRQVRTALGHLIATKEVTRYTTAKFTVVTVSNYDRYQEATSKAASCRQAADKLPTSYRQQSKNVKESKKEKERGASPSGNFSLQEREEQIRKLRE